MVKLYSLRLQVFLFCFICSMAAFGQINTPSGAIIPFGSNKVYAGGILPGNLPTTGAYGQATDAANAYTTWKSNYIVACGSQYRVKFDDPNKTVSEGVAYGLLLAAYAADKSLFDGLWAYYKANKNGNGVMDWTINGCSGVGSAGGATDAELDAAAALLVAETQWPLATSPYDYQTEATTLITAIQNTEMDGANYQVKNGDGWNTSLDCRNPSYHAPAYFRLFASAVPAQATFWNNAVSAAYSLVSANANATTGLVSDWCSKTGGTNACQSGSVSGQYGYDACRNPWRMATDVAWYGNTTGATGQGICNKIANYINGKGATNVGGPVQQSGGTGSHYATFVSTFAAGCVGASSTNQNILNQMYSQAVGVSDVYQNGNPSGYFGNTLRCISLFTLTGNFWKPGSSPTQEINVQQNGANISSGGTYDLGNIQQGTNQTYNFTIQNLGQTALTVGTVTFSGATAGSTFSVATAPATSVAANSTTTLSVKLTQNAGTTGPISVTMTIPNNDSNENPYTITLTATSTTAATAPVVAVDYKGISISSGAAAYSLGMITQSATAQNVTGYYTFNIKNTGSAPLSLQTITATGTGYSIYAKPTLPFSVATGATTTFTVAILANTATGNQAGTVTITSTGIPNYVINLTANVVNCQTSMSSTHIIDDYEANMNIKKAYNPKGTPFNEATTNPAPGTLNPTTMCMTYTRRFADGTYDGIRYGPSCTPATFDVATIKGISMLVYSPGPGIPIILSAKTSAGNPIDAVNYTSDIKSTTTLTNGWEKLFFDLTPLNGSTAVAFFDIMVDPTLSVVTSGTKTFYFDQIQFETPPCVTDLPSSGVFMDYDSHRNLSLLWLYTGTSTLSEAAANPNTTGINTSATVAKFVRSTATGGGANTQGWRYVGCQQNINLADKTTISMLVYSGKVGIPIRMALVPTTGTAVGSTVKTTVANQWEKLYFDFSSIKNATNMAYMDIAPDTAGANITPATNLTYYFDDIKYDILPCPTGPTVTAGGVTTFCQGGSVVLTSSAVTGATGYQWKLNGTAIATATTTSYTVNASGDYTVTATAPGGCVLTSAVTTVTVNPIPAVPTVTAGTATTFCSGGSVTLTGSTTTAGVTYQWNNAGTPIATATNATYNATASGTYTVSVVLSGCSSVSTPATTVTVNPAPVVPTVTAGTATTFCSGGSVTLTGSTTTTGVTYQWNNGGTPIASATNATYNATTSGTYTITVTKAGCSATSTPAITVTVNPTPVVPTVVAGTATTFCAGGSVTLTGSTSTAGVTYQWNNGGTPISTATNSTYSATASGTYTVTVSKTGCSSTSTATTVTVNPVPVTPTTTAGTATTFCAGGSVTLTGNTSTTGVTYQWNNAGTPVSTATNATYNATASGTYTITVSKAGCSATSTPAITVTVNPSPVAPTITAGGATSFCTGGNVTLTGSTSTTGVTYQWNNSGTPIATATNATYTATTSGTFTLTVSKAGCSATSATPTTVTVGSLPATPTITAGSATTFCAGGSVTLTGSTTTGGVTYQWNNGGTPIASATNATYNATTSGTYTVTVSTGCTATSAATTVTVNPSPVAPTITAGGATSFCTGGSVTLTGSTSTAGVTYQWNNGGTPIATATTATYSATASGTFTLTVSKAGCSATSATPTTVTVGSLPATPTITAGSATTFCAGGSVTLTGSTTTGGVTYQWNNGGTPIASATNATYSATTSGTYTVTVSTGCTATSAATTVTVNPSPAAPTITAGSATSFCTGGSVTLTGSTSTAGVTYQWNNGGTPIATATSATYSATASGTFTLTVSKAGCSATSATPTTVTVGSLPATPTISAGSATTFCAGGSVTLTGSTTTGGVTYQWNNGGTPIASATNATYNATTSGTYTVTVSTGCSATSVATTVTVNPSPVVPTITAGSATSFCTGGSVTLTGSTSTAGVTYQWNNGGTLIANATNATYSATTSGDYTVKVALGTCSQVSTPTTVTVTPAGAIASVSISNTSGLACSGVAVTFTASATAGGAAPTYQWMVNTSIVGTNSITYSSSSLIAGDVVKCIMTSSLACSTGSPATSNSITIGAVGTSPCTAPAAKTITGPVSVSPNQTATYSVSPATGGSTYHWTFPVGTVINSANADSSIVSVTFGASGGAVVMNETNAFGTTPSSLNVAIATGVVSQMLNAALSISPNPASGLFNVNLNDAFHGSINMKVINPIGETVYTNSIDKSGSSEDYQVDIRNLPAGIYLLEIESNDGLAIKRLVKQ